MIPERRLSQILRINYPIIQAPMLGVTTPEMVVAASESLCLGSLPVGGLSSEKTASLISAVKKHTDKPYAVNLFVHDVVEEIDFNIFEEMQNFLERIHQENNLFFERITAESIKPIHYSEQIPTLIQEKVPVVSFTFGIPDAATIAQFKKNGTKIIGTATCVKEAILLEAAGVDAITAQGIEAGGHRGSFLKTDDLPEIGLIALVAQLCEAVKVPVIAAGGIYNAKTAHAAYDLGAEGIQVGTLFIPADESEATAAYKLAVLSAHDTDTKLTKAFTGRWARGIKNTFMERMDNSGLTIPFYTYQNYLTAAMRSFAKQNNNKELMSLWAGQSAGKSQRGTTADILNELISSITQFK